MNWLDVSIHFRNDNLEPEFTVMESDDRFEGLPITLMDVFIGKN